MITASFEVSNCSRRAQLEPHELLTAFGISTSCPELAESGMAALDQDRRRTKLRRASAKFGLEVCRDLQRETAPRFVAEIAEENCQVLNDIHVARIGN